MGFNEFLSSIFGNKSTRDMKEIQPWVEKIKAAYPAIASLSNDDLRAKTAELKAYIHNSAAEQQAKVDALKAEVENTELEKRESLFNQIDKLEKEMKVNVKIRYSSKETSATILPEKENIRVIFDESQRAVTPGQSAVFYIEDIVLGGGKIV